MHRSSHFPSFFQSECALHTLIGEQIKARLHPPYRWALNWDVVRTLPPLHLSSGRKQGIFVPQKPGQVAQRAESMDKIKVDILVSSSGKNSLAVKCIVEYVYLMVLRQCGTIKELLILHLLLWFRDLGKEKKTHTEVTKWNSSKSLIFVVSAQSALLYTVSTYQWGIFLNAVHWYLIHTFREHLQEKSSLLHVVLQINSLSQIHHRWNFVHLSCIKLSYSTEELV